MRGPATQQALASGQHGVRPRRALLAAIPSLATAGVLALGEVARQLPGGGPVGPTLPWLLALALHMLGGLCALVLWRPAGRPVALRAAAISLSFPVVGPLAAWLCYPPEPPRPGPLVAEYRDYISLRDAAVREGLASEHSFDEAVRRELSVRPLVEELRFGEPAAKQAAAMALASSASPAAIRILRAALEDPDGDARLFASLALGKAEEELEGSLYAARASLRDSGATPYLSLAAAARRYAESELPSSSAAEALWREVAGATEEALRHPMPRAMEAEALLQLGLAQGRLGEPAAAAETFSRASKLNPTDPKVLLARCEALHASGQLEALRRVAAELLPLTPPGDPLREIAAFWAGQGELSLG